VITAAFRQTETQQSRLSCVRSDASTAAKRAVMLDGVKLNWQGFWRRY